MYRSLIAIAALLSALGLQAMGPIDTRVAVEIGGIKQWIALKGTHDSDPILLFLHGGPGASVMSYAGKFTGELEKHFVVVQWDQRETGQTKKLNSSVIPLTVALFENDAVEVIRYLMKRFAKERVWLMGHSWGGFLGMTVAAHHPELLECYLAISPMIYQLESERMSLEMMLEKGRVEKNEVEVAELSKVRLPFENGDQLFYHRKWLAMTMGQRVVPRTYIMTWSATWLNLFREAMQVNFIAEAPVINCPIYFFEGTKDYQTHFKLLERYYSVVKANKKDLFWFTNSAHLLNLTEPVKMQEIIIKQILPSLTH